MSIFSNLQPSSVFKFFEEISQIPRGSGEETEISNYLVNFAKERDLQFIQDEALNVIIIKPATVCCENEGSVILQSHMDMVNEKNMGTLHDFSKDSLNLYIDGDFIKAKDTTLGADNGIGLAMSLSILDGNYKHPKLIVLVTTNEESGMTGAKMVNAELFKDSSYLINLDTAEEGYLTTSCSGGVRNIITIPILYDSVPTDCISFEVSIKGLMGGHSGSDIHLGLANSNRLLARVLHDLMQDFEDQGYGLYLSYIAGGLKDNAIPREAYARISVLPQLEDTLKLVINNMQSAFKKEYREWEPNLSLTINEVKREEKCFKSEITKNIVFALNTVPLGVFSSSKNGNTLSSNSIGIVTTKEDEVAIHSLTRSSFISQLDFLMGQIKYLASIINANYSEADSYAPWEYRESSKLQQVCTQTYKKMFGEDQIVTGTHGGLECGILYEKMPHLDIVSFGPNNFNLHTPEEKLSISSTLRVYDYLVTVLNNLEV